jgi:hypothetical protein
MHLFSRKFFTLYLMVSILTGMAQAAQAGCNCPVLPMAGTYGGEWPLTLSYVDGDDENCPSILRLQASRTGAPDVDVELVCDAANQQWTGFEMSPFGGPFVYILSASPGIGMQHNAEYAEQLQVSLRASDTLHLKLMLPAKLILIGKKDREMDLTLLGKGTPAPCMCAKVRGELAYVIKSKAGYSNAELLAKALQMHVRGKSPKAKYWMDDERKLHKLSATISEIDYDDMVDIHVDGEASTPAAAKPAARLGKVVQESLDEGTFAGTNTFTCEISMPSALSVRENCNPEIVLQAAYDHESVHQKLCQEMNATSIYYLPNGRKIDWKDEVWKDGVYIDGRSYPKSSAYDMWSQYPENVSRDEIAGYNVEIEILNQWLGENCP